MTFIILYGNIRVWKCEKARNTTKGGMNMFNRVEFEVAVLRSGLKKKEVAKLMGINEATLYLPRITFTSQAVTTATLTQSQCGCIKTSEWLKTSG